MKMRGAKLVVRLFGFLVLEVEWGNSRSFLAASRAHAYRALHGRVD